MSHYNLYRKLTELRKTSNTLKTGNLKIESMNNNEVLMVVRQSGTESIILLINFKDDKTQKISISDYTFGSNRAFVIVSSIGFDIEWG